jgi:glycosyltransferase involved in cell wall biosynthesis
MSVSVIIPVWNGAAYVAEAIRSVLQQTCPPREILVVNDGSTDSTTEIVRSFPTVTLVQQENTGVGPARNTGVGQSSGDLLAFLDHDDLWMPEKLALQVRLLEEDPKAEAVLGHVQNFISPDLSPEEQARIDCPAEPMAGHTASALLVRRNAFLRVGRWPTSEREGVEWFIRAREAGLRFGEVPQVVARRRLHQSNRTRTGSANNRDFARILLESLARRRAGQAGTDAPVPPSGGSTPRLG